METGGADSPAYEPSVADSGQLSFETLDHVPPELPFRVLDLLETPTSFRREVGHDVHGAQRDESQACEVDPVEHASPLFGGTSLPDFSDHFGIEGVAGETETVTQEDVFDPAAEFQQFAVHAQHEPLVDAQAWQEIVATGFSQHRKPDEMLRYPWEMGALADIFNFSQDPLPLCPGLAEQALETSAGASGSMQTQLERFLLPDDAKYVHAVKSLQDLQYFEEKNQKTDLACAQWLNILAIDWSASGIGPQLAASLQRDSSGDDAIMILKPALG